LYKTDESTLFNSGRTNADFHDLGIEPQTKIKNGGDRISNQICSSFEEIWLNLVWASRFFLSPGLTMPFVYFRERYKSKIKIIQTYISQVCDRGYTTYLPFAIACKSTEI